MLLTVGTAFLLVELRGSGGVSNQLEQIAHILHEEGYWKPHERVWNHHRQDVYHLGKSVQRLFDDSVVLARRLERVQAGLEHIRQHHHLASETAPQQVFDSLVAVADLAAVQGEVEAIVNLLEPAHGPSWFRWLFLPRRRHTLRNAFR